jgi:hypothetical protein
VEVKVGTFECGGAMAVLAINLTAGAGSHNVTLYESRRSLTSDILEYIAVECLMQTSWRRHICKLSRTNSEAD